MVRHEWTPCERAFAVDSNLGEAYALVSIGLISFAAVAQFAPALFGGMYWRGGTRVGAMAGLLVGFGTRLGSGCTSGHGVCGLARLSPRSMVATGVFMLMGMATVAVVRMMIGGGT